MGTFYNPNAGNAVSNTSMDDTRRIFNFGDRVAELAPQQSPFFVYLSKVAKKQLMTLYLSFWSKDINGKEEISLYQQVKTLTQVQ